MSTPRRLRCDISDQRAIDDSTEPAESQEPIEKIDSAEPTLPIEAKDPTLPMDRTEPFEPMDKTLFSDHNDHREVSVFMSPSSQSAAGLPTDRAYVGNRLQSPSTLAQDSSK
jgi:hypothetical protein